MTTLILQYFCREFSQLPVWWSTVAFPPVTVASTLTCPSRWAGRCGTPPPNPPQNLQPPTDLMPVHFSMMKISWTDCLSSITDKCEIILFSKRWDQLTAQKMVTLSRFATPTGAHLQHMSGFTQKDRQIHRQVHNSNTCPGLRYFWFNLWSPECLCRIKYMTQWFISANK